MHVRYFTFRVPNTSVGTLKLSISAPPGKMCHPKIFVTMTYEQTVHEILSLARTPLDNAYEAKRNRIILKVFLRDLSSHEGFHKKVAATVLSSIVSGSSDSFIGRCSQRQAEFLAEAAVKFGIRFCRPRL